MPEVKEDWREWDVNGMKAQSSCHSAPDGETVRAQFLARKKALPAASEDAVSAQWSSDRVGTRPIRAVT